jgi:hypothetical protein
MLEPKIADFEATPTAPSRGDSGHHQRKQPSPAVHECFQQRTVASASRGGVVAGAGDACTTRDGGVGPGGGRRLKEMQRIHLKIEL